MLRACLSRCPKAFPSPPLHHTPSSPLHTSSVLLSQRSQRTSARNKKLNIAKTQQRRADALKNRPSVVLGTHPSQEAELWSKCDLSAVLVNQNELRSSTELHPTRLPIGTIDLPSQMGFGVATPEKRVLLEELPLVSMEMRSNTASAHESATRDSSRLKVINETAKETELRKTQLFAKVLDLRNANAAGIAFENRRRIILAFSTPANPFDPGRTEVQVALLTYKIRNLWTHLMTFKRDVGNRRGLRMLVHQRAKLLRYLKGKDRSRYETILERLALEPKSVEGELVI